MGLTAWLALALCILTGAAATLAWARRLDVVLPAAVALVVQGVLAIGLYLAVGLWAPDATLYDDLAREVAAHLGGGPPPSAMGEGKEAFPNLLGVVYYVVGAAPAIGLALNWAAHGLLVTTLAGVAKRTGLPVVRTAWLAALLPPALFWSSFLLRESISWLLMALFIFALVGLARRITLSDVILVATSLVALLWFRGTAAIILGAVGMAVLVASARRTPILLRLGVALGALLVLAPRLADLLAGYTTIGDLGAKRSLLSSAADTTSFGGETAEQAGQASSFVDSILRVAVGPYPWEWPTLGAPFALDALVWWAVIALTAVGWWKAPNRVVLLLIVLPALAISVALMLTSGNYGTMQRLRVQTSVLLLPVVAAGWLVVETRARRLIEARRSPAHT